MKGMSALPAVRQAITRPQWRSGRMPHRPGWSWLLAGGGLLVGGLMLLPPVYLLLRAAGAGDAAAAILLKASTLATLARTLGLAGAVTCAAALIAVPIAWLTTCTDLPLRRFWTVATTLPLVLPSYVAAYLLAASFGPKGLLQQLLAPFGVERLPEIYGFPGAFAALTLMSYPYILLTVRAALKGMDPALLEAARSLGLSPWRAFWRVTLPQLRPALVAGGLLVALYVLRDFGAVTMMRFDTFTRMIFIQYRSFADRGLAAVLALVLVGITAVLVTLEIQTRGRGQYARRSVGAPRRARVTRLGRWRLPAVALLSVWVGLSLVGPAASLLYWFVRGALRDQVSLNLWQASWNSVTVSMAAALLAILAALPVAILSVRRPGRLARALERLTYVGYALPGIVVALAFVFFGAQYAIALYQTLPLLILAYLVLFVPQAVGATRTSLLQVPPSLEEAARSLGQSPRRVFQRVTLPLLQPGLLAALGLVFLTAMKELPATLILSPYGYRTLATAVWQNISEAFFAQAAAPALLLILLSSIPLAFLTLRER